MKKTVFILGMSLMKITQPARKNMGKNATESRKFNLRMYPQTKVKCLAEQERDGERPDQFHDLILSALSKDLSIT
jgi:hypothetical protein